MMEYHQLKAEDVRVCLHQLRAFSGAIPGEGTGDINWDEVTQRKAVADRVLEHLTGHFEIGDLDPVNNTCTTENPRKDGG